MCLEGKVCYIIGYRRSSLDREKSLNFLINWLLSIFPQLEILIVEQSEKPLLQNNFSNNCKVLHIYNNGPYNRGWAFNYGVKQTDKEIIFFGDSDMFMSKDNYLKCFEASLKYDVVCPEDHTQKNVKIDDLSSLKFSDIKQDRTVYTYSGGMMLMKRSAFENIGGWDEDFEGWGAEDNAFDHIIKNTCSHIQLFLETYHIDHERQLFDGNKHPNYNNNYNLSIKIESLRGQELYNYINSHRQKYTLKGNPDKYRAFEKAQYEQLSEKNVFVLAITTYNRLNYLKQLLDSWEETKNSAVNWKLVIADDGSDDGTIEFLESNYKMRPNFVLIKNERTGVAHQFNTILNELNKEHFDVCFKCDDDIIFLKKGWDELYYYGILDSGFQHLIYYSLTWREEQNRKMIIDKSLANSCSPMHIQGAFFTITPAIIEKVGYMDTLSFGFRGYEHIDYSWRCCRLGFNKLESPFDVLYSNDFIELQIDNYQPSLEMLLYNKINEVDDFEKKKMIVHESRTYIPYQRDVSHIVGYKYLSSLWKSIAQDMHETIHAFYKKTAMQEGKTILDKHSYAFYKYIADIVKENTKGKSLEKVTIVEKKEEAKTDKVIYSNHNSLRLDQLLAENSWYKKELEKLTLYYKEEEKKIMQWYDSLSLFSFIKRKIKSKLKK